MRIAIRFRHTAARASKILSAAESIGISFSGGHNVGGGAYELSAYPDKNLNPEIVRAAFARLSFVESVSIEAGLSDATRLTLSHLHQALAMQEHNSTQGEHGARVMRSTAAYNFERAARHGLVFE